MTDNWDPTEVGLEFSLTAYDEGFEEDLELEAPTKEEEDGDDMHDDLPSSGKSLPRKGFERSQPRWNCICNSEFFR